MRYIESPQQLPEKRGDLSIFMAGGITDCPDWQQDMKYLLEDSCLWLVNPRRANFPIHNPDAAREQITWEHEHLRQVDAILFWFPCETICPIVLYELGAWSMAGKLIFVGVHPNYTRRQDVEIQTQLIRPEIEVVYRLDLLASQVFEWDNR